MPTPAVGANLAAPSTDPIEQHLPGPTWPAQGPGPNFPASSAAPTAPSTTTYVSPPGYDQTARAASSVLFEQPAEGPWAEQSAGIDATDPLGAEDGPVFPTARTSSGPGYVGWQLLPHGLMYPSYLASPRAPRFGSQWVYITDDKWYWDAALGARVGLLRFGSYDPAEPQGWQLDLAGGAFPRLSLEENRDLVSVDFRIGVPLTLRRGRWEWKFGYYHLSSHLGDEYLLSHDRPRINYVREALVWAAAWRPFRDVRLYAEADFAFYTDGGAEPWAFQFGAEYSPLDPAGLRGAPFLAVNGHLREENDFGGNFSLHAGWQWRAASGHLLRAGFHYLNGMSPQYQFFDEHEEQIGAGIWYDF